MFDVNGINMNDFLKLTYVHHDCFVLESAKCVIVFDYWTDPLESAHDEIPGFLRDTDTENTKKPVYVLVSHFHKDHFNPDIFKWSKHIKDIRYVISRDVRRHARYLLCGDSHYAGFKPDPDKVSVLQKGESYVDDYVEIRAYGSTDVGNSYAVTLKDCGKSIFHAGDLNCWTWRDESTAAEIESAENAFRSELKPIARAFEKFDIAMFPVDSRIGTGYAQGASEFVRTFDVGHFFPMHFNLADNEAERRRRVSDALEFGLYAAPRGEYVALTAPYQSFLKFI